jgi:hypothetical protein
MTVSIYMILSGCEILELQIGMYGTGKCYFKIGYNGLAKFELVETTNESVRSLNASMRVAKPPHWLDFLERWNIFLWLDPSGSETLRFVLHMLQMGATGSAVISLANLYFLLTELQSRVVCLFTAPPISSRG